jgi:hypothetical protein
LIKVEVVKGALTTKLYFETRGIKDEDLNELDEVYQVVLGSMPKLGGYTDSNKFLIEVKNEV